MRLITSLQEEAQLPAIEFLESSSITDDDLVRAVLDGDEQAFAEIFDRHRLLVTRVVGRFFRDRSEIEECVQLSFTKTYFSLKSFRGGLGRSFPSWLTRIAVNVCYDEFRRRQRRPESRFAEMDGDETLFIESISDGNTGSAETNLAAAQMAEKILSSLDPKDRIAMMLVYTEDYSLNDAADVIGISASNLKSRLFRCRNHIRERFKHLFE
ncbi:MAG: RNA polymerase sigma factor [Pyrinomonadaceae bacterium]